VATMDHNVPTVDRHLPIKDELAAAQVEALIRNCREFGSNCSTSSRPTRASFTSSVRNWG